MWHRRILLWRGGVDATRFKRVSRAQRLISGTVAVVSSRLTETHDSRSTVWLVIRPMARTKQCVGMLPIASQAERIEGEMEGGMMRVLGGVVGERPRSEMGRSGVL